MPEISTLNQEEEQKILSVARRLFFQKGVDAVQLNDVSYHAQLDIAVIEAHFKNEIELSFKVLENYLDETHQEYEKLFAKEIPCLEKIKGLIQLQLNFTEQAGYQFMQDLIESNNDRINDLIDSKTSDRSELVMATYAEARATGEIRADIKLEFIQFMFFELREMMRNPYLQAMYDSPQELWEQILKFNFFGAVGKCE